jgi:superfamily I DNA and/or RNA helicase
MTRARSIAFGVQTRRLAELTIDRAEIIASTLSTAATPIVADSYCRAEGLIIDEAARVPESANWPIMKQYVELTWKILVGDPDQLPSVVYSSE